MFKALLERYRQANLDGFWAASEARRELAKCLHPFLVPSWKDVEALAKRSPHCFSSPYYAAQGAMDELLKDSAQIHHLAQYLGISCEDAAQMYRVWAQELMLRSLSNYAGD